ncbi:MAG: hypothetical protein NTV07_04665 [Candidatus Omnitrophica bacterium]|nr:hypothetical protein [Candidatus Omnitrophota bacterium]
MLLEVILSVVVIATSFVFIMRSYVVSLKATDTARNIQKACLALEDELFELDMKGELEEGESAGDSQDGAYSWRVYAQPIDDKKEINLVEAETGRRTGTGGKIKVATYIRNKST